MKYSSRKKLYSRRQKIALVFFIILMVFLATVAGLVRKAYSDNLKPLNASDNTAIVVTVDPGSTYSVISRELQDKGVIKSDWAFEWYVRNNNLSSELKAGTYLFRPSQSVQEIVDKIVNAQVATDLVTILPGKRLHQIRESLIKDGFSEKEVDKALDPDQYRSNAALADLPKGASLEGYLYPESFQKTAETEPEQIIRQSLDEMNRYLSPEVREAFNEQGLTVHQGIILASLVEGEVSNDSDRAMVAQVFLKRLKEGIPLQSNATDEYAKINPAYNSYKRKGLPPGPVSNVTTSALNAVAFPAQTDWLYFVSGDDGVTHFSKTLEEHEALTRKHCTKLCNQSN